MESSPAPGVGVRVGEESTVSLNYKPLGCGRIMIRKGLGSRDHFN